MQSDRVMTTKEPDKEATLSYFPVQELSEMSEEERQIYEEFEPVAALRALEMQAQRLKEGPLDDRVDLDFLATYEYKGKPLSVRKRLFVANLLTNKLMDPDTAACAAGYKCNGSTMMSDPAIQNALNIAIKRRMLRLSVNGDRVLEELAKLAYGNLADVVRWNEKGEIELKSKDEIPEQALHAVSELVQIKNPKTGEVTTRVRLHDKIHAVNSMMKHLGMMTNQLDINMTVKSTDALTKARERVIEAVKSESGVYEAKDA